VPGELDGLVAAVTGGGSGIGLATVRLLAARGAAVAALDLDPSAAAPVEGVERPLALVADVTDEAYLAGPLASATTGTALAVDGGMQGLRLRPGR
jgi:NADP-dependent 3-hydroxy acid dehydrogenase YdfG